MDGRQSPSALGRKMRRPQDTANTFRNPRLPAPMPPPRRWMRPRILCLRNPKK
jgi:hypothetical protein